MDRSIHRIIEQPRRNVVYGLLAILVCLLVLFVINEKNWRPLKNKSDWKASSNYSKAGAKFAIDKNLETYWTSYVAVTNGMFFQVDLGAPATINAILFDLGEQEGGHPIYWAVKTSRDGEQWQTVVPTQEITYRSFFAIIFPAQKNIRYLQVIHTSTTSKRTRWVISELELFQPLVPWQFERSSLIFAIAGNLFALAGVFLVAFFRKNPAHSGYWILAAFLLLAALLGWGLRVYDIGVYELSAKEFQIFSALNIEEARHARWLGSYFQQTRTGIFAWIFLCIRWAYQMCQDYAAAIRTVPAIFSTLTILFLCVLWRKQASELSAEEFRESRTHWELVFVILLLSLTLYPILLSRQGEFTVSLLFFLLSYLLTAYRFLYQQGGYGWLPLLVLLLLLGAWVEPAMLILPAGIVVFEGIRQIVNRLYIGQTNRFQKSQLFRGGLYLLSVLPLYGYWRKHLPAFSDDIPQTLLMNIFDALQLSSFSGVAAWVVIGCACIGLITMLVDRKLFEWFLFFQCLCFTAGTRLLVLQSGNASLILIGGFFWLAAKGLVTLLSVRRIFSGQVSFYCKLSVGAILAVFLSVYAVNSFFAGNANFPYAPTVYEQNQQQKGIQSLIHTLLTDSSDCSNIATLDEALAEEYSALYPLHPEFTEFTEMQRLADQGRFWPYLLLAKNTPEDELQRFLKQHYIEIESSARVNLYTLREQEYAEPQRYIWQDLYRNLGSHLEDEYASSQFVRVSEKGDPPGFLIFGPSFSICQPGQYLARFVLRSLHGAPDDIAANLAVVADTYHTLARVQLTGRDFPESTKYYAFDLPFELDMTDNPAFQKKHLQYFVEVTGNAEVRLDYIELIRQF